MRLAPVIRTLLALLCMCVLTLFPCLPFTHQALRLPRALRLVPQMKRFFSRIIGDGFRLLIVVLIVLVFLGWFAVISMQLFGYVEPRPGCENLDSVLFRDFLRVSFVTYVTLQAHDYHMTIT